MTRAQFILELTERLHELPKADREKAIEYYLELIDDRIDDGIPEEEAVAAVGSINEITTQILCDVPHTKFRENSLNEKKFEPWVIVLLIAGSPIWISLLAAVFSIVVSVYAGAFAVVVSLFATSVALIVCAPLLLLFGVQALVKSGIAVAMVYWGIAFAFAGLAVFLWIGGDHTVKGCVFLSKKLWLWVKSLFLRMEGAK